MTDTFSVLPLSPVREGASSLSFISSLHEFEHGIRLRAWQQNRLHREHFTHGPDHAAAACGSVGIERLHLIADARRLCRRRRASRYANAYLIRLATARAGL